MKLYSVKMFCNVPRGERKQEEQTAEAEADILIFQDHFWCQLLEVTEFFDKNCRQF